MSLQGLALQVTPYNSYLASNCSGTCTRKNHKEANGKDRGCACFHCSRSTKWACDSTDSKVDWRHGGIKCCASGSGVGCPDKPRCSKPSLSACDILAQADQSYINSVTWNPGATNSAITASNAQILCTYNQDKIVTDDIDASLARINKWKTAFLDYPSVTDPKAQQMYDQLMADLATRQTTQACMQNPFGKGAMPRCSILNSTTTSGTAIRKWFDAQPDATKDTIRTTYCNRYTGDNATDECACINRDQFPLFVSVNGNLNTTGNGGISASCWWAGCMDGSKFFINSTDPPKCGVTSVCEVINQFIDNNIDQSTFNTQTSCTYNNNTGSGTIISGGGGSGVTLATLETLLKENPQETAGAMIALSAILLLAAI